MGKGEEDEFEGLADEEEEEEVEEEEYANGDGADEDGEEEGEDEGEDRRKKRGRASQFIDDAAEEDDEEDEDEDDGGRKRSKKGAGGYRRSEFIDDVAQVASDDEEEEEEEEDGFIDREADQVDDVERPSMHHRRMMTQEDEMNEMSEEDYARMLEERYRRVSEGAAGMDDMEATEVEQQALLPSVRDTKLWMVKCRPGMERDAVLSLMQKFVNLNSSAHSDSGTMHGIASAIAVDGLKEHIYVEAMKEKDVKEACQGNRLVSAWSVTLVPIKEMAGVLTVHQKVVELSPGAWVRIKGGPYAGDLAQVVAVDNVKGRALYKVVPRIDLQAMNKKQNGEPVVKRKFRPPARFFSLDEARAMGVKMQVWSRTTGEQVFAPDGQPNMQFEGGYELRWQSLKFLESENVVPTLDELQKFQRPGDEEGGGAFGGAGGSQHLGLAPTLANKTRSRLLKGDPVEVIEGDLKGIRGRVEKVEDDEVTFRPIHADLKDALVVKAQQLRKFFKTGDHVKVIAGQYDGETGMVVKVEGQVAIVISDTTRDHVKVFCRDLISSTEITATISKLGEYELHDLVQLDQTMAGVITKIEAGGCVVLKAIPDRSDPVHVKLPEILRKISNRNVSVQDAEGRAVSVKDPVRVVEGVYKGKQGVAEHIFRGLVFVLDRNHLENGGYFCARARSCRALKGNQSSDFGKPPPRQDRLGMLQSPSHFLASPRGPPMSPGRGVGGYGRGGGGGGSYGGGRYGSRRDDILVGRIVKIRSGPYKGYRGRVIEATDTNARIELESMMRVVTVRRDQLPGDTGAPGGAMARPQSTPSYRESPFYRNAHSGGMRGNETPMHPSRTPMHPGYADPTATPIHEGMRTPLRDPAWNPNNPTTPLRPDNYDDSDNPAPWAIAPPRSAYTPYTPNFSPDFAPSPATTAAAGTPGGYDAATPSTQAGTPYADSIGARTPYDAATPAGSLPGTPGMAASPYAPASSLPGTPGVAPSPYPGAPLTASSPFIPSTPADLPMTPGDGAGGHGDSAPSFLPGILVNVPRPGRPAETVVVVVREILQDGSCRVGAVDAPEEELFVASQRQTEPLVPRKNDRVLVLVGDARGARGKLIGTDQGDGIVKMDADNDVKILALTALGKLAVA